MVLAALLVIVSTVILAACLQHARTEGFTAPGLPSLRRTASALTTPSDDLPPPGLSPLIPSPRALASEFERGLRELTFFLAVQPPE